VAFSTDGKGLASAGLDGIVKVWGARPWTPELRAEQRARCAVKEARNFVDPLFASSGLRAEVIRRIEQDTVLRTEVRQQALDMAKRWWENPRRLNVLSWQVVAHPGASPEAYALAVRQAETACSLEPDNGSHLNTLGLAQYRAGRYESAVRSLTRSDKFNSASKEGRHPADIAFLTMAHFKLGQKDKAQALVGELGQLMKKPQWSGNAEAQGFLREAEDLLAGKP
jgi:hypothetical protein